MILAFAFTAKLNPSNLRMSTAYAFAPAVAPILFVGWNLIRECAAIIQGRSNTPAAVLIGALAPFSWNPYTYAAYAVVVIPIALLLRRSGKLNGLSILILAEIVALVMSVVAAFLAAGVVPGKLPVKIAVNMYVAAIPFGLSGLAFWAIAGYDDFVESNKG